MAAVLPKQMDVGHLRSQVVGRVLVLILGGVAIGTVRDLGDVREVAKSFNLLCFETMLLSCAGRGRRAKF